MFQVYDNSAAVTTQLLGTESLYCQLLIYFPVFDIGLHKPMMTLSYELL